MRNLHVARVLAVFHKRARICAGPKGAKTRLSAGLGTIPAEEPSRAVSKYGGGRHPWPRFEATETDQSFEWKRPRPAPLAGLKKPIEVRQ